LRRLFGRGATTVMDIFIEARVSRALISVNNAHMRRCLLRQYHTQGTYKIADRPATDGFDAP
jgi:hypothetical protein